MIFGKMKFRLMILVVLILVITQQQSVECKFEWKLKPKTSYRINENETIKLDCEFQSQSSEQQQQYFVIWSKDGTTLALNNQLANLNSTNHFEINGTYNLIIKNLQGNDSGIYKCQLFQSNDLYVNINLTVLVPPKYLKINIEKLNKFGSVSNNGELIEGDKIKLDCCTNVDTNPEAQFKWFRRSLSRSNDNIELINNNNIKLSHENYVLNNLLCNSVEINLNRYDNNYEYRCNVFNEVLNYGLNETVKLTVEYKPEVSLHVADMPRITNKIDLVENFDTNKNIKLFCNTIAKPDNSLVYEWFLNNEILSGINEQYLNLNNLNQSANYSCKCTNKHGFDQSYFYVNILYANLQALNKSEIIIDDLLIQQQAQDVKEILIKSSTNSTITLNCELKTNYLTNDYEINWYYFKYENERFNKIQKLDSNKVQTSTKILNNSNKLLISKLTLNYLNNQQFGYYVCSLDNFKVKNSLEQTYSFNLNSTYYLQIQFAPNIKVNKNVLFANNNDQLELMCEIESNPESTFVWQFNNKELASNYKYNITTKIIYKNNDYNELNRISFIQTKLQINSMNSLDYGSYACKASNLVGESVERIIVEHKRVPDVPKNLTITKIGSNNLILNWLSGLNGGDYQRFLLTINDKINETIDVKKRVENDNLNESIEIKNLESSQTYEFKLLAFNKFGSSGYSASVIAHTNEKSEIPSSAIQISNAKFKQNENTNEEICFELKLNENINLNNLTLKITYGNNFKIESIINDFKMNNGVSCVAYLKNKHKNDHPILYLPNGVATMKQPKPEAIKDSLIDKSSDSLKTSNTDDLDLSVMSVSLCYENDTSICTQAVPIIENRVDISTYFTLIAISCSILFIFIILIIVSICCCCLRKKRNEKNNNNNLATKLIVKTIPTTSISYPQQQQQQQNFIDCNVSDNSTKSTQNMLSNGTAFYSISNNIHVSDDNKFFPANFIQAQQTNTSSVLTVESDVISSTSSSAISSGCETSKSNTNSNNINSGYILTDNTNTATYISTNSLSNNSKTLSLTKQALLYAPSQQHTNIYSITKSQQQLLPINSQESAESGYSTPTNHFNKKLFYEVIV